MSNDGRNPRQILIEDSRTDPRARIDTDAVPEMHRVEWAERLIRAFPGRPLLDIEHSKPHIRPFDGMASDALRRDGHEITVSADGNWDLHPIDIDCADVPLQRDRFCRARTALSPVMDGRAHFTGCARRAPTTPLTPDACA